MRRLVLSGACDDTATHSTDEHPMQIGSFLPSSRYLCYELSWDCELESKPVLRKHCTSSLMEWGGMG